MYVGIGSVKESVHCDGSGPANCKKNAPRCAHCSNPSCWSQSLMGQDAHLRKFHLPFGGLFSSYRRP
jgi:hypothetical protein